MAAPMIRMSEASHQFLKELARQTGKTILKVLDCPLDADHRKLFFEQLDAGYRQLQASRKAWAEHRAERRA